MCDLALSVRGDAGGVIAEPHPTEVLGYHGDPDDPVEIDVEIVPLVRAVWAAGFDTELSCQDHDGYVWLEFPGKHAQRFLNALAARDGELRANILGLVPVECGWPHEFRGAPAGARVAVLGDGAVRPRACVAVGAGAVPA